MNEVRTHTPTLWVIEDDALFRHALDLLFRRRKDVRCSRIFERFEDALAALKEDDTPDVVLVDIGLPGMSGIEGIRRAKTHTPTTDFIVLTIHEENESVFEAICAGASGYLLKSSPADDIVKAVKEVRQGGAPINSQIARRILTMFSHLQSPHDDYGLSGREREILAVLVSGLSKRRAAEKLILSQHTIDTHIRNIYAKMHVHSRGGAVAKALKEHLL
jgi:DNA-binding NarL/FixJ family response regulator